MERKQQIQERLEELKIKGKIVTLDPVQYADAFVSICRKMLDRGEITIGQYASVQRRAEELKSQLPINSFGGQDEPKRL